MPNFGLNIQQEHNTHIHCRKLILYHIAKDETNNGLINKTSSILQNHPRLKLKLASKYFFFSILMCLFFTPSYTLPTKARPIRADVTDGSVWQMSCDGHIFLIQLLKKWYFTAFAN